MGAEYSRKDTFLYGRAPEEVLRSGLLIIANDRSGILVLSDKEMNRVEQNKYKRIRITYLYPVAVDCYDNVSITDLEAEIYK